MINNSFKLAVKAVVLAAVFGVTSSSCSVWKNVTTNRDKNRDVVTMQKSEKPAVDKTQKIEDIPYTKIYRSKDHNLKYRYAMKMFELKKFERAIALFENVYPLMLNSSNADSLVFFQAMCHFRKGTFETSNELFDRFRKRFTYSPLLEEAEYHYAKGFYYMSPRPERDQTQTYLAIKELNEYLKRYPKTVRKEEVLGYLDELQQKIYDKELLNAKVYYNVGHHKSAVFALKNILSTQPETTHREEVMYLIVKSSFELAENSVEELRHERYLDTIDNYYNFISEYPETKFKKDVDKIYKASQKFVKSTKKNNKSEDGNQEERSE